MESIVFSLVGLLSRLATSWNRLITSVREVLETQFSRVATLAQGVIGVILWCVPVVFWTIMIRFVVKHW